MSKQIANIADLRTALMARHNAMQSALPPSGGAKIKLKAKEGFVLPDGETLPHMEVVVLDIRYINAYYAKRYQPGVVESPSCWAISADAGNMTPSESCQKKVSDSCIVDGQLACAFNEFGSSGAGKACKNMVRLAVVPPDATANTQVMLIELPPTSMTVFNKAVKALKVPIQTVIFELSLDSSVDYAKVKAEVRGEVDVAIAPHLIGLIDKAQSLLDRGYDFDR